MAGGWTCRRAGCALSIRTAKTFTISSSGRESLALLSDEQVMIRDMARSFATEQLAPNAAAWDRESRYPEEAVAGMAGLGLLGMVVPEEWGGAGADTLTHALAIEEIAAVFAADDVIAGTANGAVIADPAAKGVITRAAIQIVVVGTAENAVAAIAA